MKLKLSIFLIWTLLAALFFYATSCSRETVPVSSVKHFTVISHNDSTFIAKSGKLEVMFFRVDCDPNIYDGKVITVSQGNRIK